LRERERERESTHEKATDWVEESKVKERERERRTNPGLKISNWQESMWLL
jgi:hypothetical protein